MRDFWRTGAWGVLVAVVMLAWVGVSQVRADRDPNRAPFKAIHGASAAEEALLATLLSDAFGTLHMPQFRRNLLALAGRYPVIYAKPDDQEADVAKLARIVGGEGPFTRYAPADVVLVGGDEQGDPTRDHASAGQGQGHGRYAAINIGRNVLEQYRSPNLVAQSCAVNVAAHEYAHTISTTLVGFGIAFTDTTDTAPAIEDREHPGTPVASYLIGTVAQCTWLQLKGRIEASGVPACVETFGVASSNWRRCNRFGPGQPVAPRPDIPPPSPPL